MVRPTFWVFLETRSVVATAVIGAAFSVCSAVVGPVAGTFVDRHRKHLTMQISTVAAVAGFAVAAAVHASVPTDDLLRLASPWFWVFVVSTLLGAVAGQQRGLALATCVTLLVPEDRRDKANGMVGTVTGISFALTSVLSGLVVGVLGMGWAFAAALVLLAGALVHLRTVSFDEPEPAGAGDGGERERAVDIRAALDAIRAVPGLFALILLAGFNNLLTGVFAALVDPYGLSLVSVETWGILWGCITLAFIGGGIVVARRGLGANPLRLVLMANLTIWAASALFAVRSSIVLLTVGMVVWLAMIPVIEAAEQTVLQRSIPFERQGRVFGFAQLVENAASPVTTLLVAPLAQGVFMPTMTDGLGADLIGRWFGTGPERGLALLFTLAGLVGVVATLLARSSRSLRRLDMAATTSSDTVAAAATGEAPAAVAPAGSLLAEAA